MENANIKKRILFDKDKDACFLTYNILIILDFLGCYNFENGFVDYRKLSYLIDFVSSDILTNIIVKFAPPTTKEKIQLRNSYINASSRQNRIYLVLQALQQKGIINLIFDKKDVFKNKLFIKETKKDLVESIINKKYFKYEYENLKKFQDAKSIKGIRTYKFTTLLKQIYENNGVKVWEV